MDCSIIYPSISLLIKHLVIGTRQKAPNFSVFHWSPYNSLVSISQHFVTTRVVHLPKRTDTNVITELDLITELDRAVRDVHSCNSWFLPQLERTCLVFEFACDAERGDYNFIGGILKHLEKSYKIALALR